MEKPKSFAVGIGVQLELPSVPCDVVYTITSADIARHYYSKLWELPEAAIGADLEEDGRSIRIYMK